MKHYNNGYPNNWEASMNMITKQYIQCLGVIFLMITSAGCTLDDISSSKNSTITKEDLQAASQILGESLSSDKSGVLLSLNDALTDISSSGFSPPAAQSDPPASYTQFDRSGIGNESNYQHSYDAQTGIHAISFDRQVKSSLFNKTVTNSLNYQFKDGDGNFIEFPRQDSDRIKAIAYNGRREGQLATLNKESFFVRQDTFLIDGASSTAPTLNIDGVHNSKGTITIEPANNSTIERSYELEINFLNIEIQKSAAGKINTQRGVTGSLSWEMLVEKTTGQGSDAKTMRGTIKLSGDGTALFRFEQVLKRFQVNLTSGNVKDQEKEYEGQVQSVSTSQELVTLINGRTIYLSDNTQIDSKEYPTLTAVQQAINNDLFIWAEGEGSVQNGNFVAEEIEFEIKDADDSNNGAEVEFEEQLTSVNIAAGSFTLGNQVIVQTNDQTIIDESGDYQSLQAVADALNQGKTIEAEGEAIETDDSSEADLIALDVQFDLAESDSDEDDNDNEDDD